METAIIYYFYTGLIVATYYRSSLLFKSRSKITPPQDICHPEVQKKMYRTLGAYGCDKNEIQYAISFYRKEDNKIANEAQKKIESEVQAFSLLNEIVYMITMTIAWPVLIYFHLKLFIDMNRE